MLSRIANSLFWMGRYLERAEHIARYMNVHLFMALDAPAAMKNENLEESVLFMGGTHNPENRKLSYQELFQLVAFNEKNPASINMSIFAARENARGAKDSLSSELWESINRLYHYVNNYKRHYLQEEDFFNFNEEVMRSCLIINSYMDHTLIHNEIWSLIHMGVHLERASQICRILISKIRDINNSQSLNPGNATIEAFHCIALLKSTLSLDMTRLSYKAVPNLEHCLEFMILQKDFSRSILFNLNHTKECFEIVFDKSLHDFHALNFQLGKICSTYNYLTLPEVKKDTLGFLSDTLNNIYNIATNIEKTYLTY